MSTTQQPGDEAAGQPQGSGENTREPLADSNAGDASGSPADAPERELRPEDQARVDDFLKRGVNSVERKPFRPIFLMVLLIVVVAALSLLSQLIARIAGVV